MNIIVNGEERTLENNSTIIDLLKALELPGTRVAVEVNKQLVRRAEHELHQLNDGDQIEVVTFVGGG
jgi:sulfur carrier protein